MVIKFLERTLWLLRILAIVSTILMIASLSGGWIIQRVSGMDIYKYDWVAWLWILPLVFLISWFLLNLALKVLRGADLLFTRPATGVVISSESTGLFVNGVPEFAIRMRIKGTDIITECRTFTFAGESVGGEYNIRVSSLNPGVAKFAKSGKETVTGNNQETAAPASLSGRTQAQGVVLSSRPTGNIINGEGEMILNLKVTRPDGSAWETTVTKPVPHGSLSFTQPGSVVHVYYLPDNEQDIVIGFF